MSTNLGGWINKTGVFAPTEEWDYFGERGLLRWRPNPRGQHIELGISEMNLFLLLGQFGLAHELHGETVLPVGTVYDPFVRLARFERGQPAGAAPPRPLANP